MPQNNSANRGYRYDFRKTLKASSPESLLRYFRVERYFTRPLASLIVRLLLNTGITPNQITIFAFILGICAGIFLLQGTRQGFIFGAVLAQLSSVFDCADGMLARVRGNPSAYGAYLDLFLDRFTDMILLTTATTGYYRFSGDLDLFIITLLGIAFYFLQISIHYITQIYRKQIKLGESAEARGLFIFVFSLLLLIGQVRLLIYVLLFTTVSNNLLRVINLVRYGFSRDSFHR